MSETVEQSAESDLVKCPKCGAMISPVGTILSPDPPEEHFGPPSDLIVGVVCHKCYTVAYSYDGEIAYQWWWKEIENIQKGREECIREQEEQMRNRSTGERIAAWYREHSVLWLNPVFLHFMLLLICAVFCAAGGIYFQNRALLVTGRILSILIIFTLLNVYAGFLAFKKNTHIRACKRIAAWYRKHSDFWLNPAYLHFMLLLICAVFCAAGGIYFQSRALLVTGRILGILIIFTLLNICAYFLAYQKYIRIWTCNQADHTETNE